MLRNRCWSLIAVLALAGVSSAAEILPQKTVAGRFTLKAGTPGEQALDLMNQFQYLEAPIKPTERLARQWLNLPLMCFSNYLLGDLYPRNEACFHQVLEFARLDPKNADVAKALIFFARWMNPSVDPDCAFQKAQRILIDHHLSHPSIGEYAKLAAVIYFDKQAIALVHHIYENHPDPTVRAMTKETLASLYRSQAGTVAMYQEIRDKAQGNIVFSGSEGQEIRDLMKIGKEKLLEKSRKYE